jgi:hypothetical protein
MDAKEIYEKIDLAKLPKETADKLRTLEKKTKGFTIKSSKIDAALKQIYDRLKNRMPEALKDLKVEMQTVEQKVETKAGTKTAKVKIPKVKGKKKVARKTPTPSAPKKRRTVATLASEIRKADESWQDALARAGKQMKEETKKAEAATKKELDKLRDMLKSDPAFSGYPRTYGKQSKTIDVSKDAKTKALPAGKRVSKKGVKNQYGTSKGGRTYWENRDNRSDRMSPNYPTKVYLEYGGSLATQPYWLADNPDALVSTETMGEMFEVGGEVFVPTEQLADNPNALVSTTTYAELFEKGGKLDMTDMFEKGGLVFVYYPDGSYHEIEADSWQEAKAIAEEEGAVDWEFKPQKSNPKGLVFVYYPDGSYHEIEADSWQEAKAIAEEEGAVDWEFIKFEKGGKLPKGIKYYGVNEIEEIRLKGGRKIKGWDSSSGVYVSSSKRKGSKEEDFQQKLELKKGGATNWKGEKINWKEDYEYIPPYEIEEVELTLGDESIKGDYVVSGIYLPKSDRTKLLEREMKARMKKMEKGGKIGFEGLAKKVAKNYEGKAVAPKYQEEYGKRYSKAEALEVGRKVAAKIYGMQQAKK